MNLIKNENGYYEVSIKGPGGKRRTRSLKTKDREQAKLRIREAKIAELELAAEMGVLSNEVVSVLMSGTEMVTVEKALRPWEDSMRAQHKSEKTILNCLTWIRSWAAQAGLERRLVSAITPEHFDTWVNAIGPQKLGTRTVMLSCARSFCRFCSDKGWIRGNPANLVSVNMDILTHAQKETRGQPAFTVEEIEELLADTAPLGIVANPFWHAAIMIGRYTGLRLSDIACLEWDTINLDKKTITVWTQKRDKRVVLPLEPDALYEELANIEATDMTYVFPEQKEISRDPSRRSMLSVQFKRLCEECGIFRKSFHGLRATYITDCDRRGIPIEHISRAVGHTFTETTRGYIR